VGGDPCATRLGLADINVGILYIFAISVARRVRDHHGRMGLELEVPVPRRLRSAAQMVSYEVSIGFVIITVLLCAARSTCPRSSPRRTRASAMLGWYWLWLFPMFVIFMISAMAETNRPPFDLPEAESELVAGFAVEYSSTPYLLFMLGEYVSIMVMCAVGSILFLGGWLSPIPFAPFTWIPGHLLVRSEGELPVLHHRHRQGDRAALPLRPAHAARLEGVPAHLARGRRDRRIRVEADQPRSRDAGVSGAMSKNGAEP
jgi:NADH:ubiquinone oxidoreductase subunit H